MGLRSQALIVGLVGSVATTAAHAEEAPTSRGWHGELMAGGYLALGGPAFYGSQVLAIVSPGGAFERFGVRASVRGFESSTSNGFATLGVHFEGAASRPRLALGLFAEAGPVAGDDGDAVAGAGVHTTVGILGPLALSADAGAHLFVGDGNPSLAISATLTLGLAH